MSILSDEEINRIMITTDGTNENRYRALLAAQETHTRMAIIKHLDAANDLKDLEKRVQQLKGWWADNGR